MFIRASTPSNARILSDSAKHRMKTEQMKYMFESREALIFIVLF